MARASKAAKTITASTTGHSCERDNRHMLVYINPLPSNQIAIAKEKPKWPQPEGPPKNAPRNRPPSDLRRAPRAVAHRRVLPPGVEERRAQRNDPLQSVNPRSAVLHAGRPPRARQHPLAGPARLPPRRRGAIRASSAASSNRSATPQAQSALRFPA